MICKEEELPVRCAELLHVEHQPLEVLPFGVVNVDRVVGGLGELVQDADVAAGLRGSRKKGSAEEFLRHGLRAGEGEQDASRTDLRECARVEAAITLHGVPEHLVVLGESRGIEDDKVVPVADVPLVLHGVGRS